MYVTTHHAPLTQTRKTWDKGEWAAKARERDMEAQTVARERDQAMREGVSARRLILTQAGRTARVRSRARRPHTSRSAATSGWTRTEGGRNSCRLATGARGSMWVDWGIQLTPVRPV